MAAGFWWSACSQDGGPDSRWLPGFSGLLVVKMAAWIQDGCRVSVVCSWSRWRPRFKMTTGSDGSWRETRWTPGHAVGRIRMAARRQDGRQEARWLPGVTEVARRQNGRQVLVLVRNQDGRQCLSVVKMAAHKQDGRQNTPKMAARLRIKMAAAITSVGVKMVVRLRMAAASHCQDGR